MVRQLTDRVIVVTGASSGIGRATVGLLAGSGATVVAAARRGDALEELAAEHRGAPGEVHPAPLDVTDAAAVDQLAADTVGRFGKLDGWVNDAAVNQYGRFEELPLEEWRQVVDTNLFGYVHGARAAIPWFRDQGRGVLVNVSSILAKVPAPLQSAYVTSKYAISGLSDALRQELQDAPGIEVSTILPGPIDTPLFAHAANRTGVRIVPPQPVVAPERVAAAIAKNLVRPRREVPVGVASGRVGLAFRKLVPGLTEKVSARAMAAAHLSDDPAPPTPGNLVAPSRGDAEVTGGWAPHRSASGARTALVAAGVAAGVGVAIRARAS
ncbi:SDR family NAD(P)-dependent oxidoreductase [Nitriliruptoraceae bacterium ZYF776]|nr:SDR family NAD(P)-dependent oxidoreductase [Profundirhabdus halotolerans]